jgi:hypothetical protein
MPTAEFHRSVADLIEAIENYDKAHTGDEDVYLDGPIKLLYQGLEIGLQLVCIDHGCWLDEDTRD